eukprot:9078179-Pyramimonas_sp.AAC.1
MSADVAELAIPLIQDPEGVHCFNRNQPTQHVTRPSTRAPRENGGPRDTTPLHKPSTIEFARLGSEPSGSLVISPAYWTDLVSLCLIYDFP